MPNYYYIKSGGTATGNGGRTATQRTGSFAAMGASAYYNNIANALTEATAPVDGDVFIVSAAHAYTLNSSISWDWPTSDVFVVSVSDTNCDQYQKATSPQEEQTAATSSFNMMSTNNCSVTFWGIHVKMTGNGSINTCSSNYGRGIFIDCTFHQTSNGDDIAIGGGNCSELIYVNCEFIVDQNTNSFGPPNDGSNVYLKNCIVSGTGNPADVFDATGINKGTMVWEGGDISGLSGNLSDVHGGSTSQWEFRGVRLNASLTLPTSFHAVSKLKMVNCASTSAAAEYQFYYRDLYVFVEEDTAIYRDGSTAFPSGQKISLKVATSASVDEGRIAIVDLPTRYVDFSSASEDVVKLYILSSTALTDADVWIDMIYPDGTNKHVYNFADSTTVEPFRAGTTLTTNTEAWTGRTSENRYEISIDTSGDAGSAGVPIIRMYIVKPSTTFYVCPTIGLS